MLLPFGRQRCKVAPTLSCKSSNEGRMDKLTSHSYHHATEASWPCLRGTLTSSIGASGFGLSPPETHNFCFSEVLEQLFPHLTPAVSPPCISNDFKSSWWRHHSQLSYTLEQTCEVSNGKADKKPLQEELYASFHIWAFHFQPALQQRSVEQMQEDQLQQWRDELITTRPTMTNIV